MLGGRQPTATLYVKTLWSPLTRSGAPSGRRSTYHSVCSKLPSLGSTVARRPCSTSLLAHARMPPGRNLLPLPKASCRASTRVRQSALAGTSLTATAQNRALQGREYRPIAELLFDQLRRRGLSAEQTFRQLVSTMAFGLSPEDRRIDRKVVSLEERTANARVIACTPAKVEPIVVWLGYQGRVSWHLSAGRVTFMDAHWAVPNARAEGQASSTRLSSASLCSPATSSRSRPEWMRSRMSTALSGSTSERGPPPEP